MIQNPKNLYSGNAVLFNSNPFTNFAINQLAQKQAKSEALDRYFADQIAKQTTTGMRQQEIPALIAARNDAQQYFQKNRKNIEDIRKDNGKAYSEMQQKINQLQQITSDSKGYGDLDKSIFRINANPDVAGRILPKMSDAITQHNNAGWIPNPNGQGVINNEYDPNTNPKGHKSFNVDDIAYSPKPYDGKTVQDMTNDYLKNIPPDVFNTVYTPVIGADGKPSTTQRMQQKVGTYSDETASKAYKGLIAMHDNDPRMQQTVDQGHTFNELKPEDAVYFNQLNDINKKLNDGKDITTNGELFAAERYLTSIHSKSETPKLIVDEDAKRAQALKDAYAKQANSDQLIRNRMALAQNYKKAFKDYSSAKSEGEGANILSTFNNNTYNAGTTKLNGGDLNHVTIDGNDYKGRVVQVPQSIIGNFSKYIGKTGADPKDPSNWIHPDFFYMTEDKKNVIPIYLGKQTSTGGNYILPDSKPIPIQNWNVELSKLLLTKSKAGNEITNEDAENEYGVPTEQAPPSSVAPTKTDVISGSVQDFKAANWTDAQIKQAEKAGKIKVIR